MPSDDEVPVTTPGRNDPCPCGSGRKYKHCCLRSPATGRVLDDVPPPGSLPPLWDGEGSTGGSSSFHDSLRQALAGQDFTDLADAQAFLDAFTAQHNHAPAPGFDGLSPDQMRALLYAPTRSPQVLRIADTLATPPRAPLLGWFKLIANGLGEDGVPATQRGNLPRALCRDVVRIALDDPAYGRLRLHQDPDALRSEEDALELHEARVIAREAGLLRLYRRRWTLTRRARAALDAGDDAGLYLPLFDARVHKIDWRYTTRYDGLDLLQQTWPFVVRLLQRYGDEPRPADFYVAALLDAFPSFADEAVDRMDPWVLEFDDPIETALQRLRHQIEFLVFERFAQPLGLVTLTRYVPDPDQPWRRSWTVESTPLAHEVVRFEV